MLVRYQMNLKRTSSLAFYLLLGILVVVPAEDSKLREEALLRQLVDPETGEIDPDMAELLWIHCRLDLIYNGATKDLNLFPPEKIYSQTNKINLKCQEVAKDNIQKLFSHPQFKKNLLACLRKDNIVLDVSIEDHGSKNWYTKYLESLPKLENLRQELLDETAASTPSLENGLLQLGVKSTSNHVSSTSEVPTKNIMESEPQPVSRALAESAHIHTQHHLNKMIIIAVVVTASATLLLVSLLFFCCIFCTRRAKAGKNDERPLLTLRSSSYSQSSSQRSSSLRNSVKEGMLGPQNLNNNADLTRKPSLDELLVFEDENLSASQYIGASSSKDIKVSMLNPPGRTDLLPRPPGSKMLPSLNANSFPSAPSSAGAPSAPPAPPGTRPPAPPPVPPAKKSAPPPPPPLKGGPSAPRPPPLGPVGTKVARPSPLGEKNKAKISNSQGGSSGDNNGPGKTKLKPFFWDKVQANPDHAMVWNQLKAGSFQFNEEMIENLFGYSENNKKQHKKNSSSQETIKSIKIIEPKKAQNLSILLKALSVTTEEVCDALREGNELPAELVQTLLKMAPTEDEELKLRVYSGDLSLLGPAERFLKSLVEIPFAFKRLEALLFMCTLDEEVAFTKEAFATLEVACNELKNSRLFLKLLEAVLKTGNRMNDGTFRGGAQAFKLDTLLKLADVKGVDGKTTLLHFVVREIIRTEGIRAVRAQRNSGSFSSIRTEELLEEALPDSEEHYRNLGLEVVSGLGSQLEHVRKTATLDADSLTGTVSRLGHALVKIRNFLNKEMSDLDEDGGFHKALKSFVPGAEADVKLLLEEERRIMELVKSTGDYFHGKAGKDEGLRLFAIVCNFLKMLEKACKEVKEASAKTKRQKPEAPARKSCSDMPQPVPDIRRLFPAVSDRRRNNSDSDNEN